MFFSLAFGLLIPPRLIEELTVQHMYRAVSRTPQTSAGSGVGGASTEKTADVWCRRQGINIDAEALASMECDNI